VEDQKWSTALDTISIYTNLKCSLTTILATSLLFYPYSLTSFKVICTTRQEVESNRSLIYICNLRELKSTNCENIRPSINAIIRVLVFDYIAAIKLKLILNLLTVVLWGLLSLLCLIVESNSISSPKASKLSI
jgi:hypothetical protein